MAILNYDNPFIRSMAAQIRARVLYYGLDRAAHLWADQIESFGLEGIRFRMHYNREVLHVRVAADRAALGAQRPGLRRPPAWPRT